MLRPSPPSPPLGPPRGTNFSLRKATQPFPPLPDATWIRASSTNMEKPSAAFQRQGYPLHSHQASIKFIAQSFLLTLENASAAKISGKPTHTAQAGFNWRTAPEC